MRMRPLGDRIVVRLIDEGEEMYGMLHIPAMAKEKPTQGEVVAVGPGAYEYGVQVPMTVAVGERVLFGRYAGTEVEVEGQALLVIRQADVMSVLDDGEAEA